MKIFIICSKKFYEKILPIQARLEKMGHIITLPNCYDDPLTEEKYKKRGRSAHSDWKASMIKHSQKVITDNDAVLVLNFEKDGVNNYIGGATFLEMYDAFRAGKRIYLYNDIPDSILTDEVAGFNPVVLRANLSQVA
jgi:hypothetical protein